MKNNESNPNINIKAIGKLSYIIVILIVVTTTVFTLPVLADNSSSFPELPMQIYGVAYDDSNNANLAENKEIVAHLGSETFSYVLADAGKIGGSGVWDGKMLISSKSASEGDTIYFTIDGIRTAQTTTYKPSYLICMNLTKPGDTSTVEVKNTTITWNAETTADLGYSIKPSALSVVPVPMLINQKSGKSISLDEKAKVYIIKNNVETEVDSQYVKFEDGVVSLTDGAPNISLSDQMKVVFISRPLGDPDGDGVVTVNDAVRVAQSLVKLVTMDEKGKFYGDADSDGEITVNDAVKVAQRLVDIVDNNYE